MLVSKTIFLKAPQERRAAPRRTADVFFNKFLEGHPYLCRTLDASEHGLLVETYAEPLVTAERFPLELKLPDGGQTLWLWARSVWRQDKRQALQFVSLSRGAQQHVSRWLKMAA